MAGFIFVIAGLSACGATSTQPDAPTSVQAASVSNVQQGAERSSTLDSQTIEGGSVAVQVTPLQWQPNAPLAFDIAMDTHSVELNDDMMKAVVLRDDSGLEFTPSAWDGPAGGGHHREGTIKFAPLKMNTKTLTLVVKNVAGVPERLYKWELAQ